MINRAFSNLVADNQYAALGLVLIAILAQVKSVMKSLSGEMDDGEEVASLEIEVQELLSKLVAGTGLDLGEVVRREELGTTVVQKDVGEETEVMAKSYSKKMKSERPKEQDAEGEDEVELTRDLKEATKLKRLREEEEQSMVVDSKPVKKAKKKKKKGDAFDDLFAGLI